MRASGFPDFSASRESEKPPESTAASCVPAAGLRGQSLRCPGEEKQSTQLQLRVPLAHLARPTQEQVKVVVPSE